MNPSDKRSTAVTRSNKLASPASLISTAHAVETRFEWGYFSEGCVCAKRHAHGVTP